METCTVTQTTSNALFRGNKTLRVIMTTTQPGQKSVALHLTLKHTPIVTAVKAALPNIDASLEISALIAKAFTIRNGDYYFTSRDQRYQLRVKSGRNIIEITEVPTQTQVNLQLV